MIPLRDANPTLRFPVVTVALIIVNAVAFLVELALDGQGQLEGFITTWGVVPAELTSQTTAELPTLLTSMFLHGGWAHLLGNMLYLWVFGDNVEDRLGRPRFILFYLLCGVAAALVQTAVAPGSRVPTIGASGAIAGVMGGYILQYPRARVATGIILIYIIRVVQIPAVIVLGFWFILQFFNGIAGLSEAAMQTGGVAFFAHVGGFVAGFLLMKPFQLGRPAGQRPRVGY